MKGALVVDWNHDYVTNNNGSSPDRPVIKLQVAPQVRYLTLSYPLCCSHSLISTVLLSLSTSLEIKGTQDQDCAFSDSLSTSSSPLLLS